MSFRQHALNAFLRTVVKPLLGRTGTPKQARRTFDLAAKYTFKMPPFTTILTDHVATGTSDLNIGWITCGKPHARRIILYFHGGGFIVGSAQTHSGMLANLSEKSGLRIAAPNYRLAPENAFPAQLDDAVDAWKTLVARGYDPKDIILGGDSAGGGLALSLLSRLCLNGTPPAACFVFSPWTDLTLTGKSLTKNNKADIILPVARIEELRDMYVQDASLIHIASPLFADFPDCPPVFLQGASSEILADDLSRMADRLRGQGAQVQVDIWEDLPHVWPIFQGWLPEADAALKNVAGFTQECFPSALPNEN